MINNGALQDSEISAYMEKQLSDSDVSALIKKVQNELDQAQQSDPSLEEFLNGLGEEAGVSTEAEDGTMLTATEECNVRAEASTDADILGVISAGDQVQKTGTDGEWVQIDYDGQTDTSEEIYLNKIEYGNVKNTGGYPCGNCLYFTFRFSDIVFVSFC